MKKLLLITTALAVGLAGPAHADPITAAAAWVSTTFAVSVATATFVVNFAVSAALTAISSALYKPKQPATSVKFDVQLGDDLPLSFVVGDYATAGKRKYIGSWGANNRFITEVIEYSALPQGMDGIWVNDERGVFVENTRSYIQASSLPPVLGMNINGVRGWSEGATIPSGAIDLGRPLTNLSDDGNRITVKVLDGTQLIADPFLRYAFGEDADYPWTADHIGRGKSYAIITTRYDSESLTSYPTYLIEPAPLPLYDWRDDSTNGGDGPQRWGNQSTYQPTRNAKVIAYNVARGIYYGDEWVYGGKNLPAWRLPVAEWTAAANACDRLITLASGATEPRYRAGMEISVDMEPASVLEELGKSANGKFAEVGGRLKPIVDLPGAAAFAFTDGDILITEGQTFSPFYPASDTYNAISATFPAPGEKWTSKDAPEYIDTDALAEDGGEYLPTSMTYGAVPYPRQVQRLMRSQMRDFRRMRRHQFYLPPDAYALEPGIDMVSWTSDRNGYINKLFLVESVAKAPGMNVLVSLREVDPGDYDWSSDFERPVIITPPVNPRPFVQAVSGFAAIGTTILDADGTARRPAILVGCDGDETGVTRIQIEARRAGGVATVIDTLRSFSEPFSWYLLNVLPATSYEVRARLFSDLTPRSQWSSWLTVTTPDVRIGSADLRMDEIAQEVREDLSDLTDWIDDSGAVFRDVRDEIDAIRDGAADGDFGALLARDELRRELFVEVGGVRASFDEQIDVIVTDQLAAAIQTSTLRAQLSSTTASVNSSLIALAAEDSALASRIDGVEVAIGDAVAGATTGLVSRIETVEGQVTAQSDALTQTNAQVGRIRADGLFRISSIASPTGASTRIALAAEAEDGTNTQQAALFLDARTDGVNQIIAAADRFAIATGTGSGAARRVPFIVDGGTVYIEDAFIRNAAINTLQLAGESVTVPVGATGQTFLGSSGTMRSILSISISVPVGTPVIIMWGIEQSFGNSSDSAWDFSLRRGTTVLRERFNMRARTDWPSGIYHDTTASTEARTYSIFWDAVNDSVSGRASMIVLGVKR